jgi:signal transduction histidine kinase
MSATIDERKRLVRDLHDGAQQQVLAVGMQLRAAQRQLPAGHPVVAELEQAVDRLQNTVGELRRLAHGVRPAGLDEGLPAAFDRLGADCPLPVDFDVEDAGTPDVVTTTAYFVVAEAMANVLKHARASRITVTARRRDEHLHVSVADDGVGTPTGSGLTALRDRVGSIGGTLAVRSGPGAGTTIEAVLPCGS